MMTEEEFEREMRNARSQYVDSARDSIVGRVVALGKRASERREAGVLDVDVTSEFITELKALVRVELGVAFVVGSDAAFEMMRRVR